jgi:hypothetical protein
MYKLIGNLPGCHWKVRNDFPLSFVFNLARFAARQLFTSKQRRSATITARSQSTLWAPDPRNLQ